jgi:hypothetical protein
MWLRNGVIIGMSLFIVFILYLVFVISSKSSELISDDYYERDRNYQSEIEAQKNAASLGSPARISIENDTFKLIFANDLKATNIEMYLFKPNDQKADQNLEIKQTPFLLPTKLLQKGKYTANLQYEMEGKKCQQSIEFLVK